MLERRLWSCGASLRGKFSAELQAAFISAVSVLEKLTFDLSAFLPLSVSFA